MDTYVCTCIYICVCMSTHFNLYLFNVTVFEVKYKTELFYCISSNQFPVYSMTSMHTENLQRCPKFSFPCIDQAHKARRIPSTTYVEISTRASSQRIPWDRKCWEQSILCKSLHYRLEDKL